MRRIKSEILGAILTVAGAELAAAHTVSSRHNWHQHRPAVDPYKGQQTVTTFCDGKYEDIARELNRPASANILSSINLYRSKSRLPPLKPDDFHATSYNYGHYTNRETRAVDALKLLDKGQTHLSVNAQLDYLNVLNLMPDISGVVLQQVKSNSAFDWLIMNHQMNEANAIWNRAGIINPDELKTAFSHIDKQATIRPGINIWITQYQHHRVFNHPIPADITARISGGVTDIISCQASLADYGIIALSDLGKNAGLPRAYLPRRLAEDRTRQDIHTLTYRAMTDGAGLDANYHSELLRLADQLENKTWANRFLFLSAPDINTAQSFIAKKGDYEFRNWGEHHVYSNHNNLLFGLPTEYIPNSYPFLKSAHALTDEKWEMGLQAAPRALAKTVLDLKEELEHTKDRHERNVRYYSENNRHRTRFLAESQKYVDRAGSNYNFANNLDLETPELPDNLKLTFYALFSGASHNIDPHHRDISDPQSVERFLDIYLRRQLFPATRHWANFSRRYKPYFRLSEKHYNGEHFRNSLNFKLNPLEEEEYFKKSLAFKLNPLRKNDGTPEVGYAALVDWDKLSRIKDEDRLVRTMTITLFDWLESARPEDRAKYAHLFAPALAKIIRICRHEAAGEYQGAALQKAVFERLHKYYPTSDAAKRTPYWWPSRPVHGNLDL